MSARSNSGAVASGAACASRAGDADRLAGLVDRVGAIVPFEGLLIVGRPFRGLGTDSGYVLACNWPRHLCDSYFTAGWQKTDAVVSALLASSRVVTTAEVRAAVAGDAAGENRLHHLESELGSAVVGVPVCHAGRDAGFVCLRRRGLEFSPREVSTAATTAPALHSAAMDRRAADANPFTPRERECLVWTSRGKTAWEIGSVLGISEHTAVAHLNSAVAKLNAGSRAHAVAQALRHGWID